MAFATESVTHRFGKDTGSWEWLLVQAIKIALTIEYSTLSSKVLNLELMNSLKYGTLHWMVFGMERPEVD